MNRSYFIIIGAVCAAAPLALHGNTVEEVADTLLSLPDISVTAIKQTSNLEMQPVAVSVIGRELIDRWNINGMKRVSEISPNFYMPDYGSRMTSSVYVRGLGARMEQPVVGLSVDNVPVLNKNCYDFDGEDTEKVEVLRGAQTALYGRNTMGGQINIHTLQPFNYQGWRFMVSGGSGNEYKASAGFYGKINDRLAMGVSGFGGYNGGYYRNEFTGKHVGIEKWGGARWRTQWRPKPGLSVDNVANVNVSSQSGYAYVLRGQKQVNYNDTCYYDRLIVTDGLTVKWVTDDFVLSSISSFQYLNDEMTLDQDFTTDNYFNLTQSQHEWTLTQDLVIRGVKNEYSWLAGVFGFYKRNNMSAPVLLKNDAIDSLVTGRVNGNNRIPVRLVWNDDKINLHSGFFNPTWGVALYHQSDYTKGPWRASLGLRLDYESTRLDYRSVCYTGFKAYMKSGMPPMPIMEKDINIDENGVLKQHFLEFVPKVSLSYRLPGRDGSMVYATAGRGYKSGGYNTQMFSEVLQQKMQSEAISAMPGMGQGSETPDVDRIVSYKPERSWNYELGAHIECGQGKVKTDVALFYIDCTDQQITTFPDGNTTGRITTNAGRSRSYGAEFQMRYTPTLHWALNVAYGYTNAKFMKFKDGDDDFSGKYVPYAPQHTLFLSGAYNHKIGHDLRMDYSLDLRGVGRIYWNESNSWSQHFYAQLGATITATYKKVSVEAWVENLTGTEFQTFGFRSLERDFYQKGRPRRGGITVRFTFGGGVR